MGNHRAEPGHSHGPSETPDPHYVGRRAARLAPQPASSAPSVPVAVEASTSFASDVTAVLPVTGVLLPEPATVTVRTAGRRRATRADRPGARGPLRRLPSTPLLLGVATLAVAIGGAVTAGGPSLAGQHAVQVRQAGALTGTSGVAHVASGVRPQTVSRDYDRQALAQASGSDRAAGTAQLAQHDTALNELALKAEHQAARLNNNRWVLPITAGVYHLTARFGDTGLWASFHTGLDFACSTGTPIHAIASGVITFAGYDGAYGNKTVITTPDGTEIWFGHQTTQLVAVGDTVTRGEVIGTVGSTGHVTGPHVHIEVRPGGGDPVDPFPAFVEHGVTP